MDIERYNPCKEGLAYYRQYPDFKSAWLDCKRGDWMFWIAHVINIDQSTLDEAKRLRSEMRSRGYIPGTYQQKVANICHVILTDEVFKHLQL